MGSGCSEDPTGLGKTVHFSIWDSNRNETQACCSHKHHTQGTCLDRRLRHKNTEHKAVTESNLLPGFFSWMNYVYYLFYLSHLEWGFLSFSTKRSNPKEYRNNTCVVHLSLHPIPHLHNNPFLSSIWITAPGGKTALHHSKCHSQTSQSCSLSLVNTCDLTLAKCPLRKQADTEKHWKPRTVMI